MAAKQPPKNVTVLAIWRLRFKYRITSVLICVVMVLSMLLPSITISAEDVGNTIEENIESVAEEQGISRTADASTINDWISFYGVETDTSNAGKIWTDKTVSAGDIQLKIPGKDGQTIQKSEPDNFLVGLSALSSSQSVTLEGVKPVDVMLILDISGSMEDEINGESKISQLVKSANYTIQDIMDMNSQNRIGVILFSGGMYADEPSLTGTATCPLPLDHYTTNNESYFLLQEPSQPGAPNRISIDPQVKNSDGESMNEKNEKYDVQGLTYIQNGLLLAYETFMNSTLENENPEERIPVITLMTDGAPTAASTKYAARGESEIHTGNSTDIRLTFLTQLTSAWVKANLKEKYHIVPLFYTVGIISKLSEANYIRMVLNPREHNNENINSWWNQFSEANIGDKITLTADGVPSISVTKKDGSLAGEDDRYYVDTDGYFEVNEVDGIEKSFEKLVERIEIETAVSPIEEKPSSSLAFDDQIGSYMEIEKITGIMYNSKLHKGNIFSEKMCQIENVSEENEVLNAIGERIDSKNAETLLTNALNTGQISHISDAEYSNYIAWYADENGKYLSPYKNEETPVVGAKFLNRTYFYYNSLSENQVLQLDVRVEENLETEEQAIKFSIPAASLPLVKYNAVRDGSSLIESTVEKEMAYPVQLFYEVTLKENINAYDLSKIDAKYPHKNDTETMKTADFYTNSWGTQNAIAESLTTAEFTVSKENSHYYYTEDTSIGVKNDAGIFEMYTGTMPNENDGNEYYYKKTVYNLNGGAEELPILIDKESLKYVRKSSESNDSWIIPKDTFHYETIQSEEKGENITNTAAYVKKSLITDHNSVIFYFGNNGKISVKQGKLVISKTVENDDFADGDNENTEFQFEIDLKLGLEEKIPMSVLGEKNGQDVECTIEGGKIKFALKSKERIEFWLPAEKNVSIAEVGKNINNYETTITLTQNDKSSIVKNNKIEYLVIITQSKTLIDILNIVKTFNIRIEKHSDEKNLLDNAEFDLYYLKCPNPDEHIKHDQIIDEKNQECWKWVGKATSGNILGQERPGRIFFTDDKNQIIYFKRGTYRFVETKAPEGYFTPIGQWNMYFKPGAAQPIVIEDVLGPNGEKPPAVSIGEYYLSFYNSKPIDPPITGGRGIWQYFLLGAVITFGGVGLIIYQIRRKKHGNS